MFRYATLTRPRPGERVGGDAVFVREYGDALVVAIVDVLGHGAEAHVIAERIARFLDGCERAPVTNLITNLHAHLRGSRGAAAGIATFDAETRSLEYAGVGNTVVRRFGTVETRLVSHDGVLGQNMRTPRPQRLDLEPGDTVLFYTDGIMDRFSLKDYPALVHQAPDGVVRRLVERFGKSHDDAGCIAVRVDSPQGA